MTSTLTTKGQLTIPREVRKRLNLKTGDQIKFIINEKGHIEIIAVRVFVKDLEGMLPPPSKPVSLEQMEEAILKEGGRI